MATRRDYAKIKQAIEEMAWTFGVLFAISFFGWIAGWGALPDIDATTAALKAATVAGAGGAAKGFVWFLTTRTS